jgi:pyruvate/2-oxoglutarate dehydrogenase complex dihydrolipoamide acyltransferase (E2) component
MEPSMKSELRMPQLGMMMLEGTVSRWLVVDGADVTEGEEVVEIESDKVVQVIPAPADGVLRHVAAEGETIPVLEVVGYIES